MEKNTNISSDNISYIKNIRNLISSVRTNVAKFIDSHPLGSFFVLLICIVLLIIVGNFARKPKQTTEEAKKSPREVEIFSIGKAPRMVFSGKVEKSGAIKIVAQSPGVVQTINAVVGGKVSKGQTLLGLSNNYQGGNIASISRDLAQKSAALTEENFPDQLAMINRQRELAKQTDINADELRAISTSSIQATQDLIALNQEIINSLDNEINDWQSTNVGGANDTAILQAKQGKAGIESGLLSLRTALASQQYQQKIGNPPEKLSDLGKDITLGQLDLQERSLNLAKETAQLNVRIAQISESLMYPSSPCNGTVERVYVNVGQVINPGQQIASISCVKNIGTVIVSVSSDTAKQLSRLEKSTLMLGGNSVELSPQYISTEPTEGNFHSVIFSVPEEISETLSNGSSVKVEIPVGNIQSPASVPYIPIDAVFQTQTASTIYVASKSAEGKWFASGKSITLGPVFGSYVQVNSGISGSDQVILNRDIIGGDEVTFQ